jgi:hypothetical protein
MKSDIISIRFESNQKEYYFYRDKIVCLLHSKINSASWEKHEIKLLLVNSDTFTFTCTDDEYLNFMTVFYGEAQI